MGADGKARRRKRGRKRAKTENNREGEKRDGQPSDWRERDQWNQSIRDAGEKKKGDSFAEAIENKQERGERL